MWIRICSLVLCVLFSARAKVVDISILTRSEEYNMHERFCDLYPALRHDCGYFGIDEEGCNQRGCCFITSDTSGLSWCYYARDMIEDQCMFAPGAKTQCGDYVIGKEACLAEGCCWQPRDDPDTPWCYHSLEGKQPEVTTAVPEVTTTPSGDPQDQQDRCGVPAVAPRQSKRMIVGGVEANAHSWPWQVSLAVKSSGHNCGAVVLSKDWVLTAAHCTANYATSQLLVRAGVHLQSVNDSWVQEAEIREIINHENYHNAPAVLDGWNVQVPVEDIALLHLETSLIFTDAVQPACLPEQDQSFSAGMDTYATGWGRIYEGSELPDELLQVKLPIIDRDQCNQESVYNHAVTEEMICVGYEHGEYGICRGDSGGPLVVETDGRWTVIGVTSWVMMDCEDYPAVYTRVSKYVDWIYEKTASTEE